MNFRRVIGLAADDFCEERDQDEICQSLHAGRKYLRVLLHRAKARFRECLLKSYAMEGQKGA
jgi:hypothetical protein